MIEADRADYNRAKLDHDLIVAITTSGTGVVRWVFVSKVFGSRHGPEIKGKLPMTKQACKCKHIQAS